MGEPLLEVRDLHVRFHSDHGSVTALAGTSFDLAADEILGIVGESGSGQSASMMSVMRLLPERSTEIHGEIRYQGRDLLALGDDEMRAVRGSEIAMIFQDPM